jgi:hypothetical protein
MVSLHHDKEGMAEQRNSHHGVRKQREGYKKDVGQDIV